MKNQVKRRWGIRLAVPDVAAAAQWLKDNLFFNPVPTSNTLVLANSNCLLELIPGMSDPLQTPAAGTFYAGLAHVALRTRSIEEAIAWCQDRGLTLQLDHGKPFYNPKVYGAG